MISYGGDLNIIDKEGYTPVAFCTENLLKKLNLKNAIVNVNEKITSELLATNNTFFKQSIDDDATPHHIEKRKNSI